MITKVFTTVEELEQRPSDEGRFELIAGELIPMSPTGDEHAEIKGILAAELVNFNRLKRIGKVYVGDVGVVLHRDPDTVLAPDLAFVGTARVRPKSEPLSFLRQAPDLAIEIVSPSDRLPEVRNKVAMFLAAGVEQVWVVNPATQSVTVFHHGGAPRVLRDVDTLDGGAILPGFTLRVADIFI